MYDRSVPFRALALDYDGTIARNGVLDDEVRRAIAEVRAAGIPVLIVTGRIVSDLRGVAGDLDFIDAVVGENGAVLSLPGNGRSEMLTAAASPALVGDLRAARVPVSVGQCVIESDAVLAPRLQESIQRVKAPYALTFNGTRVMALPSGVTKASGLTVALRALRLSPQDAIAIGDAENDYDLLEVAGLGVAVSWGIEALRARADEIIEGEGPGAVAAYIRRAAQSILILHPR